MYGHSKATNHEDYINELDEPRRGEIKKIHEFIRKTVPNLEPYMQGGTKGNMMAYGKFPYKFSNGTIGDWCKVAVANNKNYISIYICAVHDGKYIAESLRDELYASAKPSVGKSCIRYKKTEDINWKGLEKALKMAEDMKAWGFEGLN